MSLERARIATVTAMGALLALHAGGIFDGVRWSLLIAPAVVGAAAAAVVARRALVRLLVAIAAVVASVTTVVFATGGDVGDVVDAFGAGAQRLLTTEWPSPDRPDLLGTIAAGLAACTALAADLAGRRRWHLVPLLPLAAALTVSTALSAPLGVRLWWLLPFGVLGMVFAALRPGESLSERLTLLGGERRLVLLGVVAFGVATALTIPIAFDARADPRRNDPPERLDALLDPIEATLALQQLDPPVPLHEVSVSIGAGDVPERWRTAALVDYDGRRWSPSLVIRPIGRRLAPSEPDQLRAGIVFLDDDLRLVPLPGNGITVDADIETDPERNIVRLAGRPGDRAVAVTASVDPALGEVDAGSIGSREVDESVSGLTELATELAGGDDAPATALGRLQAIEQAMSEDFLLDPGAPGAGLQRALIDRFLRETERGTAEQFATSFVLLARSLGIDARVATGYEVDPAEIAREGGRASFTLSSDDAAIWPEVRAGDAWVAFDPVPAEAVSDEAPTPPQPQTQTPAAPQPPIAPPPEANDDPVVSDADETTDDTAALSTVVVWVMRVAIGLGALLVPLLGGIVAVLLVKWRRRRRRLRGPDLERIRGAFAVATDRLIDAGQDVAPSATNSEIADAGLEHASTAGRELHRLARLASAATFGSPARPDLLADDAANCLGQVETSMAATRSRRQRLAWRLSLRSLRHPSGL